MVTYIYKYKYAQMVNDGDDHTEEKPRCTSRGGESCLAPGRGSKVPTARMGRRRSEPYRAERRNGQLEEKKENE